MIEKDLSQLISQVENAGAGVTNAMNQIQMLEDFGYTLVVNASNLRREVESLKTASLTRNAGLKDVITELQLNLSSSVSNLDVGDVLSELQSNVSKLTSSVSNFDARLTQLQPSPPPNQDVKPKEVHAQAQPLSYFESCSQLFYQSQKPVATGVYTFRDKDSNVYEAFCDFTNPTVIWTLLESFSLENEVKSFSSRSFSDRPAPNWRSLNTVAYRMQANNALTVTDHSTHWRTTCNWFSGLSLESYNPLAAKNDTAIVSLVDYDVMERFGKSGCKCTLTEYASSIGSQKPCLFCSLYWCQGTGDHLHFAPSSMCQAPIGNAGFNYWGNYETKRPKDLSCTKSISSTTQYWLGVYTNRTCLDHLRRGTNTSGVYAVEDTRGRSYSVFCDFDSEKGAAWTLIEAFPRNKAEGKDLKSPFTSFGTNKPVNENMPDLVTYRLSRDRMLSLKGSSTHWRATCGLRPGHLVVSYQDYARSKFTNANGNILARSHPAARNDIQMEYMGLYGVSCSHCMVPWYSGISEHIHFDYKLNDMGDFPSSSKPPPIDSADSFGLYKDIDPLHTCAEDSLAPTQWWIGGYSTV
ncbi:uncharacterized protein [Oscarella lobularis]